MTKDSLRVARVFLGVSQAELAEKAGISQRMICYLEKGQQRITERMEPRLKQALQSYGVDEALLTEIEQLHALVTEKSKNTN